MEEFKSVEGYEGLYAVSNAGRILGLKRNRFRKLDESNDGYLQVALCKDGDYKVFLVHRLVARAFIPNPNNFPQVNHKDCNKKNNLVDNLEWCTGKQNMKHARMHGRSGNLDFGFGEVNPNHKLTKDEVIEIRRKLKDGIAGYKIAQEYGVCDKTVYDISNGKTWKM